MKRDSILVMDFGTSSVRVNAVDVRDGRIPYSRSRKYGMISPEDGCTEISPRELWHASEQCVKEVMSDMEAVELHGITFSYFGDNLMLVDSNGEPLTNIILVFDVRRVREAAEDFPGRFTDEEFIRITGSTCVPFCIGPEILWFKRYGKDLFERTAHFYTNQQQVNQCLGLEPLNNYTMVCRKMLYGSRNRKWPKPILSFLGVRAGQLGKVIPSAGMIDHIDRYGEMVLPFTLPVIIGNHDCDCEICGVRAGLTDEGVAGDITGAHDHLEFITRGYVNAGEEMLKERIFSYCEPPRNTSVCLDASPTSGVVLKWFIREIIGDCSQQSYDRMWNKVVFDGRGTLSFDPSFSGDQGGLHGLSLTKTKEELFEAMIESFIFEAKRILGGCEKIKKENISKACVGRGAVRSGKQMQLRADVQGCRVECMEDIKVSSLGAAVLVVVKTGPCPEIREASIHMLRARDVYGPIPTVRERYGGKYREYLALVQGRTGADLEYDVLRKAISGEAVL